MDSESGRDSSWNLSHSDFQINLPPCTEKECRDRLKVLKASLLSEGLSCISEYKPNIHYKVSFRDYHNRAQFTIIHQCPVLWKRISDCQDLLSSSEKIMTVNLKGEDSQAVSEDFEKFFTDYFTLDIHDDEGLSEFLESVKDSCADRSEESDSGGINSSYKTTSPNPQYHDYDDGDAQYDEPQYKNQYVTEKFQYQYIPDAFGRDNVLQVRVKLNSLRSKSSDEFLDYLREGSHKIKDKISSLKNKPRERMECRKSIIFQVLPTLHNSYSLLALADIAVCDDPVVQARALTILEYLLYDGRGLEHGVDVNTLLKLESFINLSLRDNRKLFCPSQQDNSHLMLIQRLSNVYLMILCQVILISTSSSDLHNCNIHINTVSARPFAAGRTKADVFLSLLDNFVKDFNSKNCTSVKNNVAQFSSVNPKKMRDLRWKSVTTQTAFVFDCLTKIFQTQDVEALGKLKEYLHFSKSTSFPWSNNHSPACIAMILRGLIHFLNFGVDHVIDKDVEDMLKNTLDLIKSAFFRKKVPDEIKNLVQRLLFSNKPDVRKFIISMLSDIYWYEQHIAILLVNEVEYLLSPLLTVYKNKEQYKEKTHSHWTIHGANFDSADALLILHRPAKEDHMHLNETKFEDNDSLHENELNKLKRLEHPHIIELFAYQQTRIPQFYVVEDYKKQNLQTALKNRSHSQNFFPRDKMLEFLIHAAFAVEYIHSQAHVHRNITAASLFITSNGVIKLCEFQLCHKLTTTKIKVKKCSALPSRWCAPESLMKNEYSKASDVWMFGHLIYEVLTHGVIPYYHINKSTKEVIELIMKNKVSLSKEPCIESVLFSLISECTDSVPVSRPQIKDVRSRLCTFEDEYKRVPKDETYIRYPACTGNDWRASTDYEVGIDVTSSYSHIGTGIDELLKFSSYILELSESLLCCKMTDCFFFHEDLPRQWESEILVNIEEGQLEGILPAVNVFEESNGKQFIHFSLPSNCLGSLLDVTLQKKLGKSLKMYIYCAYKVALTLAQLFSIDWILGDIAISNLFVELLDDDIKVHVLSFGYIHTLAQDYPMEERPKELGCPTDPQVISRAAPEVIFHGTYSSASDVFCFGNLLYDILTAFDQKMGASFPGRKIKNAHQMHQQIVAEEWIQYHPKPECCPQKLYDLILMCVHKQESNRPKVPQLVEQIKKFLIEEMSFHLDESPIQASSNLQRLSVCNPSIQTICAEIWDQQSTSNETSVFEIHSNGAETADIKIMSRLSQHRTLLTKSPSVTGKDDIGSVDDMFNFETLKRGVFLEPENLSLRSSIWTLEDDTASNIYEDLSFTLGDKHQAAGHANQKSYKIPKPPNIPLPPIPLEGKNTSLSGASNQKPSLGQPKLSDEQDTGKSSEKLLASATKHQYVDKADVKTSNASVQKSSIQPKSSEARQGSVLHPSDERTSNELKDEQTFNKQTDNQLKNEETSDKPKDSQSDVSDNPCYASDKPTVASDKSTVASDKPTVASDKPTVASDKSTVASDKPTVASDKPTVASDKPIIASDKSTVASDKPTVASDKPTVASDKSTVASDKPTVASDKPTVASDKPIIASDKPTVASNNPSDVSDELKDEHTEASVQSQTEQSGDTHYPVSKMAARDLNSGKRLLVSEKIKHFELLSNPREEMNDKSNKG